MFPLFDITPQSSMQQMPIKTQNMIALTVEFTRIPLFQRWRSRQAGHQHCLPHSLDACTSLKVTENTPCLRQQTQQCSRPQEQLLRLYSQARKTSSNPRADFGGKWCVIQSVNFQFGKAQRHHLPGWQPPRKFPEPTPIQLPASRRCGHRVQEPARRLGWSP